MQDFTAILNYLFSDNLKAEGYEAGMPIPTVDAQLASMRQGQSGYDIWRAIHLEMGISEARKNHRELRDKIEDAALALGMSLHLRAEECNLLRPHGQLVGKRRKRDKEIRGFLGDIISSEDGTDIDVLRPGKQRRPDSSRKRNTDTPLSQRRTGLLTPKSGRSGDDIAVSSRKSSYTQAAATRAKPAPLDVSTAIKEPKSFPRLVYRWYDEKSQGLNTPTELRAGRFSDRSEIIPPPEWELKAVTNHLVPLKEPSPYISFRDNLRPCIFHALKAGPDTNACVTVVDLRKVRDLSIQWWGVDHAVKACPQLVKHFRLILGRWGSYKGSGEWLIWGESSPSASISILIHV
jgi:hypothetical protein